MLSHRNHMSKHHNTIANRRNNHIANPRKIMVKQCINQIFLKITQDMIIKYKFHINSNFSSNKICRYQIPTIRFLMFSCQVCRNKSRSKWFQVINFFKLMLILLLLLKLCKNLRKLAKTCLKIVKKQDIYLQECILRLSKE